MNKERSAREMRRSLAALPRVDDRDYGRATMELVGRRAALIAKLIADHPEDSRTPRYATERWRAMVYCPTAFVPWDGPWGDDLDALRSENDTPAGRELGERLGDAERAATDMVLAEIGTVIARMPESPLARAAHLVRVECYALNVLDGKDVDIDAACEAALEMLRQRVRTRSRLQRLLPWLCDGDSPFAGGLALELADGGFDAESDPARSAFLGKALQCFPDNKALAEGVPARLQRLDAIGKPFVLRLKDVPSGTVIDLRHLEGKVVVVDFWAMWCPPCREMLPELKRLYRTYGSRGLEIVSVSADDEGWPLLARIRAAKRLRAFAIEQEMSWPQCLGADFHQAWAVDAIPCVFLIDRAGRLRHTDGVDASAPTMADASERLEALVKALLDEQVPGARRSEARARPWGA